MPLITEILRNGETREDINWDYATLSCMYTVAVKEADPEQEYQPGKTYGNLEEGKYVDFSMTPIYYLDWPKVPLVSKGRQTVKKRHAFFEGTEYELIFEPGDVLRAWREHK